MAVRQHRDGGFAAAVVGIGLRPPGVFVSFDGRRHGTVTACCAPVVWPPLCGWTVEKVLWAKALYLLLLVQMMTATLTVVFLHERLIVVLLSSTAACVM